METVGAVRAILAVGPERWRTLTGAVDREVLERVPAPGEWSAVNVLQHLIDVEPVFAERAGAIMAGQPFPAFDQDRGAELGKPVDDISALIDRWARLTGLVSTFGQIASVSSSKAAARRRRGDRTSTPSS